jgi:hypothetical protein
LILETIEAGDPNDQGAIPEGSMVIASGELVTLLDFS